MKRTIIKIDEDLCNGCGLCVEGCHEGALQMIDGKARMISDLYCDGLGACIPECPVGAITLEEREAEPYDEVRVMERISPKGEATILAHLNHLIDHNQDEFVAQGVQYIKDHKLDVDLSKLKKQSNHSESLSATMHQHTSKKEAAVAGAAAGTEAVTAEATPKQTTQKAHVHGGGCPGSRIMQFANNGDSKPAEPSEADKSSGGSSSALRQWPVQLHLVNPQAPYFQKADVLLAADCVAFSMGNFHSDFLTGKGLAIACPKLDQGKEMYIEKLTSMINDAHINTLTVMVMEVPCCTGLLQIAKQAADRASRKVPVKAINVSLQGAVINEEWV